MTLLNRKECNLPWMLVKHLDSTSVHDSKGNLLCSYLPDDQASIIGIAPETLDFVKEMAELTWNENEAAELLSWLVKEAQLVLEDME